MKKKPGRAVQAGRIPSPKAAPAASMEAGSPLAAGGWEEDEAERLSERLERENRRYAARFPL